MLMLVFMFRSFDLWDFCRSVGQRRHPNRRDFHSSRSRCIYFRVGLGKFLLAKQDAQIYERRGRHAEEEEGGRRGRKKREGAHTNRAFFRVLLIFWAICLPRNWTRLPIFSKIIKRAKEQRRQTRLKEEIDDVPDSDFLSMSKQLSKFDWCTIILFQRITL